VKLHEKLAARLSFIQKPLQDQFSSGGDVDVKSEEAKQAYHKTMSLFRKRGDSVKSELTSTVAISLKSLQNDVAEKLSAIDHLLQNPNTMSTKKKKEFETMKVTLQKLSKTVDLQLQTLQSSTGEKHAVQAQKDATKIQKEVTKEVENYNNLIGEEELLILDRYLATKDRTPLTLDKCALCVRDQTRFVQKALEQKDSQVILQHVQHLADLFTSTEVNQRCALHLQHDLVEQKLLDKLNDSGTDVKNEAQKLKSVIEASFRDAHKTTDPSQLALATHIKLKKHNQPRYLQILTDLYAVANLSHDQNWIVLEKLLHRLVAENDNGKIVEKSEDKISQLESDVFRIVKQRDALNRDIKELDDAIISLSKKNAELLSEMAEIRGRNMELEKMTGSITEKELKKRVLDLGAENERFKTELKETKDKLEKAKEIAASTPVVAPTPIPTQTTTTPSTVPDIVTKTTTSPPPPTIVSPPPPPPGMMGAPPPPPSLGATTPSTLPSLVTHDPKVNLRNFHIDSIPKPKLAKSVFLTQGIAEKTKNIQLETEELDKLFTVEKSSAIVTQPKEASNELISLIDSKRAYNISIQLSSLRMPVIAIKDCVVTMDAKKMTVQQIGVLRSVAPTLEEVKLINTFDGDVKLLAKPEKFFMDMRVIPLLADRLDCWTFKLRFSIELDMLQPEIECMNNAAVEMQKSQKLFQFLTIVLAVSNYLNAKSRYKQTYGFKLSSLNKLKDTKSSDNKTSLLVYLIEYIERHHPNVLEFYEDLPNVYKATRVSLSTIKETISSIEASHDLLGQTIKKYETFGAEQLPHQDKFLPEMKPFSAKVAREMKIVHQKLETSIKSIEALIDLYNEDKSISQKPEDFFIMISTFLETYKKTRKDIQEKKKKDEEKARQNEMKQQMEKKRASMAVIKEVKNKRQESFHQQEPELKNKAAIAKEAVKKAGTIRTMRSKNNASRSLGNVLNQME
jgi:hypothetical protein